ncbi:MAG: peptide-binding protein [Candidatus Rokubacteria bacterium]|nr:peptide-binding protein [Candidatus Rokubacteria bacterium]
MGRRRARAALGLVAVLLCAAVVAGCSNDLDGAEVPGGGAPAKRAYGDTLIEALLADVSGLIPNILSDSPSYEVGGLIYNGLVGFDRDLNLVGELAESWSFSTDCLDLTFTLRPNATWHDGRPFTADDVLFTYETMVHPKTPTSNRESFKVIERVDVVGPRTVHIRYSKPYAKALQSWGLSVLPRHVLEPYVRDGKLREAPQNWKDPVGTGPYRFAERRAGEKIVLVANRAYFAGPPYISRVVYRIIPSQPTIFLELKAKGVDAGRLNALQYARQTNYPAFEKAYRKYRHAGGGYTYLGFNLKDPRFADRRVRQAIAHAIDKRELIDGVLFGLGRDATGPYKPGTWAHNPNVKTYPHDLARARALLSEAGWKEKNAEGLLVKDGKPFTFELMTNQGNEERRKVAEIVQASLRDLGIGVEIRIIEWASFIKEYVKKRRFEAIVLGWGIGPDPDQYEIWHSSKTGPDDLNHISYANPEVDDRLEKGRSACVPAERVKHYHRLQEILAEDQPVVFLYFGDALPVVSSRVHGIVPGPNGIRYNFPEWYVPAALHRYTSG